MLSSRTQLVNTTRLQRTYILLYVKMEKRSKHQPAQKRTKRINVNEETWAGMQTAERKDEKQIKRLYVRILGIGEYRTRIIRMEYDGNVDF